MIYYSLIHPYLTCCINVWSSTYRTNFKTLCTAQRRSDRTLFATAQQPHSRDILIHQRILPLDKMINQQEGILAYKVINGIYLLNDFLNHRDVNPRHQIQLRNFSDQRIPLYAATRSQLFVCYRAINTWNGLSGDLCSSSSICTFKNKLRQLYLSLSLFSNIRVSKITQSEIYRRGNVENGWKSLIMVDHAWKCQ